MATSKLALYNIALTEYLGERKLASLTEAREPRRVLDDMWDNGTVRWCLEQGQWKFAQRVSELTYNPSIDPAFGYSYAFNKPSDCVRLTKVCTDEALQTPLLSYVEEAGFWGTDAQTIYVSYVSDATNYGNDTSLWPETFVRVVACCLAFRACRRLAAKKDLKDDLGEELDDLLVDARSKDAMQEPTKFLPPGTWTESRRRGGGNARRNKVQLIG